VCPVIRGSDLWTELCRKYAYRGSYRSFLRHLAALRPPTEQEPEVRFETGPSIQVQMDWAHFGCLPLGDGTTEVFGFVAVLGCSRAPSIRSRLTVLAPQHSVWCSPGDRGGRDQSEETACRLRFAHYPVHRTLADFDFDFQPSLDRKLIADLSTLRFIEERKNIILLGPPGVGRPIWPSDLVLPHPTPGTALSSPRQPISFRPSRERIETAQRPTNCGRTWVLGPDH
jgi:hypothetical protein